MRNSRQRLLAKREERRRDEVSSNSRQIVEALRIEMEVAVGRRTELDGLPDEILKDDGVSARKTGLIDDHGTRRRLERRRGRTKGQTGSQSARREGTQWKPDERV